MFNSRPFQGQDPHLAKIVILGTDANYSQSISNHEFFSKILEYHEDGVSFWLKHGTHHPFLLPSYPFDKRRDGVRYHRNFQKMMLGLEFAEHVSFVEMLNVPTIGNTNESVFLSLLESDHLRWLEESLLLGNEKLVLINQRLVRTVHVIHRKTRSLPILDSLLRSSIKVGATLSYRKVTILSAYSFAHAVSDDYLKNLGIKIRTFTSPV